MTENGFSFVVSSGPKLPKDPALRTLIRRQAMRDVAIERKRRGNHGKINLRQPLSCSNQEETSTDSSGSEGSSSPEDASTITTISSNSTHQSSPGSDWFLNSAFSIIQNPLAAYHALCVKYNVDLQDLSGLAGFCVNYSAVPKLADNDKLKTLLGYKQFSYLQYVPSRYGSGTAVTSAVDCLLAKMSCRLNPSSTHNDAQALALYAKALRDLQQSIGDKKQCQSADTLCAIQLLSLYELLDSTRESACQQHLIGCSQLIKHRKASQFTTDYDKALFYSHVGPAVVEALKTSKHCYLEAPEWQQLYLSFIEDSTWLTNRSSITVHIRLAETYLPGNFRALHELVKSRKIFHYCASNNVRQKVQKLHQSLLSYLEDYKSHLVQTSLLQPPQSELDLRREVLGSCIEHLCLLKRMLAVLNDSDRHRLELETQALALLIQEMQKQPSPRYAWLFAEHELGVALCVQSTRDEWQEDVSSKSTSEQQDALVKRWERFYTVLMT